MRKIVLLFLILAAASSCRKNPTTSVDPDRNTVSEINGKVPENEVRHPDNPITMGAIRLEVEWQESIPEQNSVLVTVGKLIAPGPSYSGFRPAEGDALIIVGLNEAAFEARDVLIIEAQPPLREPTDEIPQMTFLKLVE